MFDIRESQLCAELQVSKDELRRRRQHFLTEGTHWAYVKKRVLLSTTGAQILRGTADVPVPDKNAAPANPAPPRPPVALLLEKNPPPPAYQGELIAWKAPALNPHLVVAYIPGTDPRNPMHLVNVLVRSNVNFLPGMKIKARHVEAIRYELVGPCPRWRGRW
nr:hypothetical protein [uncultured Rhodopila sp.]